MSCELGESDSLKLEAALAEERTERTGIERMSDEPSDIRNHPRFRAGGDVCTRLTMTRFFGNERCMCETCQLRRAGERLQVRIEKLERTLSEARGTIKVARDDLLRATGTNAETWAKMARNVLDEYLTQ